jgi:hypothetical protein
MLFMYAATNIHLFSNQMIDGGYIGSVPSPRKDNRSAEVRPLPPSSFRIHNYNSGGRTPVIN